MLCTIAIIIIWRHTTPAMAWIDYKKAYDFVPHSWTGEGMEMFGIAGNMREFLERSMVQWKHSKREEQTDSLIQTTHIFSTDIGIEFGIKKCGVLVLKRGKIVRCEGKEVLNDEIKKEVGQEGYTYLGIVELDKVREYEMEEKTMKEYKRQLRLTLKSNLNGRNKLAAINTWAVAIFRYGAGIICWRESD